jgi:soluble lytic murein transglycosylase-like protein
LVPHWTSDKAKTRADNYATIIVEESRAARPPIDPFLVVAIAYKESSFRPKIQGKRGEVGLMQIMPRSALTRSITNMKKKHLIDVRANIRVGVGHLNFWRNKCGDDRPDVWLSAYNSGVCKKSKYARRIRRVYCKINPRACGGIS